MSALLSGDLSGLELPADLERLRAEAGWAADQGESLDALYEAMVDQAPMALVDLAVGPRALSQPGAIRSALGVADRLEARTGIAGLYRRLVSLDAGCAQEVLEIAAARHPAAAWLVRLSEQVEQEPGTTQLRVAEDHPAYVALCWAHAEAGHHAALLAEAEGGRPEPCAALLSVGAEADAVAAAARTLAANPEAAVVAWLSAVAGPAVEELLAKLTLRVDHARASAFAASLVPFPAAASALSGARPEQSG